MIWVFFSLSEILPAAVATPATRRQHAVAPRVKRPSLWLLSEQPTDARYHVEPLEVFGVLQRQFVVLLAVKQLSGICTEKTMNQQQWKEPKMHDLGEKLLFFQQSSLFSFSFLFFFVVSWMMMFHIWKTLYCESYQYISPPTAIIVLAYACQGTNISFGQCCSIKKWSRKLAQIITGTETKVTTELLTSWEIFLSNPTNLCYRGCSKSLACCWITNIEQIGSRERSK